MMRIAAWITVGLLALALGAAGVSPVDAQRFPGLGGLEARADRAASPGRSTETTLPG